MSKERGNGEGSIYQRGDGKWVAAVSLPRGRRKVIYGRTRAEAAQKLTAALKAIQDGLPVLGERQTTGQYLATWLEGARPSVRAGTWERYESYVRVHIAPALGAVPLSRLSAQHLQRFYADRLESGLSPASVGHLHAVLHRALGEAARFGLVARNVAGLVKRPRGAHKEMMALSPEQARAFLDAAHGERLEALYVLALSTGMRQGELLAIRWQDVDLDSATLQVKATLRRTREGLTFGEPKTARSRRQVQLTPTAVTALRAHRARQIEERLRCPYWQDAELVFATEAGTPVERQNMMMRSFFPLLERAGLPRIRFHDLRHTAATLLLGQNVNVKVVSEMLGHSQIAITLDLYSHVTPGMQRQAVDALEAVLGA